MVYRFNTVWTSGLNDRIKIVNYTDGYTGILSWNEKYGIQFSNYDVRVQYGKYWYSFGDIYVVIHGEFKNRRTIKYVRN